MKKAKNSQDKLEEQSWRNYLNRLLDIKNL